MGSERHPEESQGHAGSGSEVVRQRTGWRLRRPRPKPGVRLIPRAAELVSVDNLTMPNVPRIGLPERFEAGGVLRKLVVC
jgi:hypothetical protein